jgi:CheY-like chemotaxis protein
MSACPQILPRAATAETRSVLIVENDILVRGMAAEHLRAAGFKVLEASNAAEAIEILESGDPVDLLFTNIAMPGLMNGAMLARWVYVHRPDVRVALASGSGALARTLPGERLFLKPYDLHQVEACIRDALDSA